MLYRETRWLILMSLLIALTAAFVMRTQHRHPADGGKLLTDRHVCRYYYNAAGELVAAVFPDAPYRWDPEQHLESVYSYDENRPIYHFPPNPNPEGNTTHRAHDGGHLTVSVTDSRGCTFMFFYSPSMQLIKVVDPRNVTHTARDGFGGAIYQGNVGFTYDKNYTLGPRPDACGFVHTYRYEDDQGALDRIYNYDPLD